MEKRPIVIVGAGPAGTATALALHRRDPALAEDLVVLDKARHPRPKVCAGGLIPAARTWMLEHDVPFDIPHVAVHHARAHTPSTRVDFHQQNFSYVVRRAELDAALADACRQRGIEVREDEPVRRVERSAGRVVVETPRATWATEQVVGADGSGSFIRRSLVGTEHSPIARAAMCDVPIDAGAWDGFAAARSDFDFSEVANGLAGYAWTFPCLIDGRPHANVGIYSLQADGQRMKRVLAEQMRVHDEAGARRVAFPIRWYRRGKTRVAAANVLLAGDAAGADPLMGEGISLAMEYGSFAAHALLEARRQRDFSGRAYQRAIDTSWLGVKLGRLHATARWFYSRYWRLCFALPEKSVRLRTLGLRWYNGIDDWDRRSCFDALRNIWRPDFTESGSLGRASGQV